MASLMATRQALALLPLLTALCAVATAQQSSAAPCNPPQTNAFLMNGCCYQCGGADSEGIRMDNGKPKCAQAFANLNQGTDPISNDNAATCIRSDCMADAPICTSCSEGIATLSASRFYAYDGCCYGCPQTSGGLELQNGVMKCYDAPYRDVTWWNSTTCLYVGSGRGSGSSSGSTSGSGSGSGSGNGTLCTNDFLSVSPAPEIPQC